MKNLIAISLVLLLTSASLSAESTLCPDTKVSVIASHKEQEEMICTAAAHANELFEACNVPPISRPVLVKVVDDIYAQCVAMYHCGDDFIEILSPSRMEERRKEDSAFVFLPTSKYFYSVVIHELAHAAFDAVPCPIDSCVVGSEYVAYSLQVLSLTEKERLAFEKNAGLDRVVGRDELSALILYMAPHLFSQKAWTHFSQREDPCGYIGQITGGNILLDFEIFE